MSVTAESKLQFYWKEYSVSSAFRSGVSLHSHTMFSEESLDVVPNYTGGLPYLGAIIRRQEMEYHARKGQAFDFRHAFWTPPLTPREAYRLEEKQIQRELDLSALVSLTDHDDSQAATLLRVMHQFRKAPVSTEWTIPFGRTFFHVGLHNLPPERSASIQLALAQYTGNPIEADLAGYLEALHACPDVLIVLNHPLWDEKGIGLTEHQRFLMKLLAKHGRHFHALEANGLRSWSENSRVFALGRSLNIPVVSGGDRHGLEPNAILNLTGAGSFSEFVAEVRCERRSHVIFMPQYREPLKLRVLQTVVDVVRDYPENMEGRRQWSDRVFYRNPLTGDTLPLGAIWKDGGPKVVRQFLKAMKLFEWRAVRMALKLAFNDRSVVWPENGASV